MTDETHKGDTIANIHDIVTRVMDAAEERQAMEEFMAEWKDKLEKTK
jgi:hypothetical protein